MKGKTVIILGVIVLLIAIAGAALSVVPRGAERQSEEVVIEEDVVSEPLFFNDGTVEEVSEGEMSVRMTDGTVETYIVTAASRFSRIEKDPEALPGSAVVVVYSKHLERPVAALLSAPFESSDPEDALEIFAGKLVSVEGKVVSVSVEGETREFVFEEEDPFSRVVNVDFSEIRIGDSLSARYTEEEEGIKMLLQGFLR